MSREYRLQGAAVAVPLEGRPGRILQVSSVGFGYFMTVLGDSANLVVEVIVLAKVSLPYEIYCIL